MSKIKTFIKCKRQMDEKYHCGNLRSSIIAVDLWYWKNVKHLLESEYFLFDFYCKSYRDKSKYVRDWEVMNVIPQHFNSKESNEILNNKSLFNKKFQDALGREYCYLQKKDFSTFKKFVQSHKIFMAKPVGLNGGQGIRKVEVNVLNVESVFKSLFNGEEECLVEEVFVQAEEMAALCADTINTIRVVSMIDQIGGVHVPFASIRIGRKGQCVDNFCAGGLVAAINVDTGIVSSEAQDKFGNKFVEHPDSGIKIIGFCIPNWEAVIQKVNELARRLPDARYVGWDICVAQTGEICVIEANHRPEARLHQIPAKRGLRDVYNKYLGDF